MKAKNQIVSGDYEGVYVFTMLGQVSFSPPKMKSILINKESVESYEILDEQHQKSAASAVSRAAVGSLLLGPVGLLAGVAAKNKSAYYIAIQFKDGKRSLIEADDKLHKAIVKALF